LKYLGYDLERDPTPFCDAPTNPFKNKVVREAIRAGMDSKGLVSQLSSYAIPATQALPPVIFGYNPQISQIPYDPSYAISLLKQAGYPNGFDVTLHVRQQVGEAASMVKEQLARIGIRIQLKVLNDNTMLPGLRNHKYSFFLSRIGCPTGDASDILDNCFHSPDPERHYGVMNYGLFSNSEIDRAIEEARRRDHRKLGPQLDLFHLAENSPGSPFWHPKGMVVWNELEDLRRRENAKRGYVEVKTPLLYDIDTYITSGHYENYQENMFFVQGHEDEKPLALKPMNCPGHMLLFGERRRSYRELPLRYAESSTLHRDERGGTLHGLLRVKHITQDDAHVFVTEEQIQDEIHGMVEYARYLYDLFGLTPKAELSTRPEKRLGTDEQWDRAEQALEEALKRHGMEYTISPGEGTFYGPKIDLHMTDSLGRSWQMGTIQLDYQMPERFGLMYSGADNADHRPVVIHRALLGSLERFAGILIEHYAGAFPFWLAPVQIRIIPVGEAHREPARALKERLGEYRVEVDERDDTVGKRIRDAEVEKIPYVIVYGDKESDESLAVRKRGGEQSTLSLDGLRAELSEVATL
jgi:threonyl-tRNA synthetase